VIDHPILPGGPPHHRRFLTDRRGRLRSSGDTVLAAGTANDVVGPGEPESTGPTDLPRLQRPCGQLLVLDSTPRPTQAERRTDAGNPACEQPLSLA